MTIQHDSLVLCFATSLPSNIFYYVSEPRNPSLDFKSKIKRTLTDIQTKWVGKLIGVLPASRRLDLCRGGDAPINFPTYQWNLPYTNLVQNQVESSIPRRALFERQQSNSRNKRPHRV